MRVINKNEHLPELEAILDSIIEKKVFLILWQVINDKREIHPVYISALDLEEDSLQLESAKNAHLNLENEIIYFFCKSDNLIFKSTLKSQFENAAEVTIPQEMKLLDEIDQSSLAELVDIFNEEKIYVEGKGEGNQTYEDELIKGAGEANIKSDSHLKGDIYSNDRFENNLVQKTTTEHLSTKQSAKTSTERISTKWAVNSMNAADTALFEEELSFITLEEEEKKFEGMRTTPRAKPPEGKMVTVQVDSGERPEGTYTLYDLSRGGFSFFVFNKEEFNAGERVYILAFDTNRFDQPMVADIKSIREADDMGVQYKVGCQFSS